MRKEYREIRKIRADKLRVLCIEENWYTIGDCEAYNHLLLDLAEFKENITTEDIVEIAQDILCHSETEMDIECICYYVARIADTFFEEV